jgi:hypothetical protein
MYKFRAVSSIQVILELCFPVLAIWVYNLFQNGKESQWKSLWKPAAVSLGVIIVLFVGIFDFSVQMMVILQSYGPDL